MLRPGEPGEPGEGLCHTADWFQVWWMWQPNGNPGFCTEPICLPASITHVIHRKQDRVQGGLHLEGFPIPRSKVAQDTGYDGESARTGEDHLILAGLMGIFEFFFHL